MSIFEKCPPGRGVEGVTCPKICSAQTLVTTDILGLFEHDIYAFCRCACALKGSALGGATHCMAKLSGSLADA